VRTLVTRHSFLVTVLALLALPGVASAQYVPRDPVPNVPNFAIPPLIRGPQSGAVPTIGTIPPMSLPPIGLPLPSIGLPPSQMMGPRHHQRPHSNNWNRGWPGYPAYPGWPVMVVMTPPGFYGVPQVPAETALAPVSAPAPLPAPAPKGSLLLYVQPARAQVLVDGYYAGTVDDFDGNPGALVLDTGAHIIELDDPSYQSVRFDVRIDANQSIVYRRELSPIIPAIAAPAVPISSTPAPMYLIPGCYLGNVPPKDAGLPATCDPSRAVRLK
jgi:hypothetical protein